MNALSWAAVGLFCLGPCGTLTMDMSGPLKQSVNVSSINGLLSYMLLKQGVLNSRRKLIQKRLYFVLYWVPRINHAHIHTYILACIHKCLENIAFIFPLLVTSNLFLFSQTLLESALGLL